MVSDMIFARASGIFNLVKGLFVNSSGWTAVKRAFVNVSGTWDMVYSSVTISSDINNPNLATLFGNPTTKITAILNIANGVVIGSSSTGTAAIDTTGLPAGSVLILNIGTGAYVVGKGGNGGPGGGTATSNGLPGGNAINLTCALYLNNASVVGGGGGGGSGDTTWPGHGAAAGGGGGGAGAVVGSGGAGFAGGAVGNPGTLTVGGTSGGAHCQAGPAGNLGAAGNNGPQCDAQPGGTGGAAGKAINLNGNTITYISMGSIYGVVS